MIAREEARLRRLFHRLLLLSAAATPAACSAAKSLVGSGTTLDGGAPGPADSGSADATVSDGASPSIEAGPDATDDDSGDATIPGDDGGAEAACGADFLDGADDGNGCDYFEALPCGLPADAAVEKCFLSVAECKAYCHEAVWYPCAIVECLAEDAGGDAAPTVPSGPVTVECSTGLATCGGAVGRRTAGLHPSGPGTCVDAAGTWLAGAARLEAASVHAFRRLGAELSSMRAPRALVRAAERAARDEVRHARVTTRLARRRGAVPARVVIDRGGASRTLEAFAVENAVEGCVRECFGALVATHQARHAQDRVLRGELARIARDETRHAALAWGVARWVEPRLSPRARARVKQAMRDAVAALKCEIAATPRALARELGLPTGEGAERMLEGFAEARGIGRD